MRDSLRIDGTPVRNRYNPAQQGRSLGRVEEDGEDVMVRVQYDGAPPTWELIDDLELLSEQPDERTVISGGLFSPGTALRRAITSVQLGGDLSELIYSLDMTNTEFMPHQFKPLLALLDSPSRGLLIADEVGLGKTIEAGLIWTELRFRTGARSILVVCPAMLIDKWRMELAQRFGTRARVMGSAELEEWLETPDEQSGVTAIVCSLQGLRPARGWDDEHEPSQAASARLARLLQQRQDETLFDLTVIDEAHYLRNRETTSHTLGALLRPVSDYFLLLSATPMNTRSEDVFSLVSLVDPHQFQYQNQFADVLEANRPLVIAGNRLKQPRCTVGQVRELLEASTGNWLLAGSESLAELRGELARLDGDQQLRPAERVALLERLQRVNLLGQVVVRSRKREVFESRIERRASHFQVPMQETESQLYQLVTEAVLRYANDQAGASGFLLAMPQQQMSSSMYAAAARWCAGDVPADNDADDELIYGLFGDSEAADPGPVTRYVQAAVRGKIDMDALYAQDSKYGKLLEIVGEQSRLYPNDKVLVFSFFRPTLAYLKRRLDSDGFPAVIVQGGDDKQAVIDSFRDDPRRRVLLASEVAAEGVDLQFMRLLVNYDLPWNPMRVEQRIGRIDRIGQRAEAISIFNLVYRDTIDARILERLFNRLRLFEESVGATEEVIGDEITRLTRDLLSSTLPPEEQERRIEQASFAIEQKRAQLEVIEQSQADLAGLGDFIRDRVIRAREQQRHISDEDLSFHIADYLNANDPGHQLRIDAGAGYSGTLKLSADLAVRLASFRQAHRMPRSRLESGHVERVVIRNHVDAGQTDRAELINQFHPLVRMIASEAPRESGLALYALEVSRANAALSTSEGQYAFSTEMWEFKGIRNENTLRAAFVDLENGRALPADESYDLLNALRAAARDWVGARQGIPGASDVVDCIELARRNLAIAYSKERRRHETENADRARIQKQSIERNRDRRCAALQVQIQRHREAGRRGLEMADRRNLERTMHQAEILLAKVRSRKELTANRMPLVSGIVRVVS